MRKRFGGSHGLQVKQCNLHDVLTNPFEEKPSPNGVVVHKRKVRMNTPKRGGLVYLPLCFRGSKFPPERG